MVRSMRLGNVGHVGMIAIALALAFSLGFASRVSAQEKENPAYKSWSSHAQGTSITVDISGTVNAAEVYSLESVTSDQVLLNVGPEAGTGPTTRARTVVPAKVAAATIDGTSISGENLQTKDLPNEKIQAGGKTYDCKVVEYTGTVEGDKFAGKVWTNPDVPGLMVKYEYKCEGKNALVQNKMLKSVTIK